MSERPIDIQTRFSEQIQVAAERFRDHEGVTATRVRDWLVQFDDSDLDLGIRILKSVRYYDGPNIRNLVFQLLKLIREKLTPLNLRNPLLVPMSRGLGGGADVIVRALRRPPEGVRVPPATTMANLLTIDSASFDCLVFIDDFGGTGQTLSDWWLNNESLVRPLAVPIFFGLLVATDQAIARAQEFAVALAVERLTAEASILTEGHSEWDEPSQTTVITYCQRTGSGEIYLKGFGGLSLLVAFKHGCPNNSLPLLWYDQRGWTTLFLRRAI